MQFQNIKTFILDKLEKELPGDLPYHSLGHVIDVCSAAENIGRLEHINGHDMQLLLTAALFHDAGFINGTTRHEEESCRIAEGCLPGYGYTPGEIEKIKGMIMATRLPQSPKNHLEKVICDADLDYLGRDDFFPISDNLYKEFKLAGIVGNENEWNKLQVSFFESHHFFTGAASILRNEKKDENLRAIKQKIKG